LGEGLGRNVVRLVDYEGPEGLEGSRGKGPLTQSLNHGDDKVLLNVELVALNSANGRTRAELLDAFDPLVGQETLVDYDECTTLELSCERQGTNSLTEPNIEGQYAVAGSRSLLDSFDLMSSKIPSKINIGRESFGPWGWTAAVPVKSGYSNSALL
jgi:hypothetical protein